MMFLEVLPLLSMNAHLVMRFNSRILPAMIPFHENAAKLRLSPGDVHACRGIFAQANSFVTALALTNSRG